MSTRRRPKKYRIVQFAPRINQFSPRGRPGRPNEANLSMDEFEAVRLAYYIGLNQKESAKSMHISQQTFSRILRKANETIAEALVNGKIIKIQGGSYVISPQKTSVGRLGHNQDSY